MAVHLHDFRVGEQLLGGLFIPIELPPCVRDVALPGAWGVWSKSTGWGAAGRRLRREYRTAHVGLEHVHNLRTIDLHKKRAVWDRPLRLVVSSLRARYRLPR